jgi:hypothetical protein
VADPGALGDDQHAGVVIGNRDLAPDRSSGCVRLRQQADVGERRGDHQTVATGRRRREIDRQRLPDRAGKPEIPGGVGAQGHRKRRRRPIGGALRGDRQDIAAVAAGDRDRARGGAVDVDRDDARAHDAMRVGEVDHATAQLDRGEARRLAVRDLLAHVAVVATRLRDRITRVVVAAACKEQEWNHQAKDCPHGGSVAMWRFAVACTERRTCLYAATLYASREHDATRDHIARRAV